jgi:hypothetical protein
MKYFHFIIMIVLNYQHFSYVHDDNKFINHISCKKLTCWYNGGTSKSLLIVIEKGAIMNGVEQICLATGDKRPLLI